MLEKRSDAWRASCCISLSSYNHSLPYFLRGFFSETVGKKKELLEGLDIPFFKAEMNIEYEGDITAKAYEGTD